MGWESWMGGRAQRNVGKQQTRLASRLQPQGQGEVWYDAAAGWRDVPRPIPFSTRSFSEVNSLCLGPALVECVSHKHARRAGDGGNIVSRSPALSC